MKTTVNPYLTFNGNCEEAFNFYKSVFGGDFDYLGRFKDMPSENPIPEEQGEKIMHVTLKISDETVLMGSDTSPEFGQVSDFGNNISLSINASTEEDAERLFNNLSEGGRITMPLEKTFWGALFGMFTDKFGINWMVNYDYDQENNS
jgi:PhnB protein